MHTFKKYALMTIAVLMTLTVFSTKAEAYTAHSSATVNMRAGPDRDYPVVARIRGNAEVQILGCTEDWAWCDVAWRGTRGWVSSRYLNSFYRNRSVSVADYGPRLDIPVIAFDERPYWNHHYREKTFYRDHRWNDDRLDYDRRWSNERRSNTDRYYYNN